MRMSFLSLVAAAVATGAAPAQVGDAAGTTQVRRVSVVIGTEVRLQQESIGKVTDIVLNDGGCVEYMVVQYADGYVVVPWSAATVDYRAKTVVIRDVKVTRDRLRELTFTQDRWPDFAASDYSRRVQSVWGTAGRSGPGDLGVNPGAKPMPNNRDNLDRRDDRRDDRQDNRDAPRPNADPNRGAPRPGDNTDRRDNRQENRGQRQENRQNPPPAPAPAPTPQ